MRYRLAGATYSVIAEKLTEDRAREYADAHGISVDRAMKKIKHVSIRTAWDDVLAEFEGLRRETEITRGDAMAMENTRIDQLYSKALSLYSKGSVPAGRLALSIMGRRAKLNGLDAPTKIAPTDPTGEHTADTGAIDVNTLSEDTLRRVLRDEKREPLDVTRCRQGAATRRFPGVSVSREIGLSEFPFALDSLQGGTVLEAIARVMAGCAIAIKGG